MISFQLNDPDHGIASAKEIQGIVGGCIISYDELHIGISASQYGWQEQLQEFAPVIINNDN